MYAAFKHTLQVGNTSVCVSVGPNACTYFQFIIMIIDYNYKVWSPFRSVSHVSATLLPKCMLGQFSFHAARVSKVRVTGPWCLLKIYRFLETSVTVDVAFPPLIRAAFLRDALYTGVGRDSSDANTISSADSRAIRLGV